MLTCRPPSLPFPLRVLYRWNQSQGAARQAFWRGAAGTMCLVIIRPWLLTSMDVESQWINTLMLVTIKSSLGSQSYLLTGSYCSPGILYYIKIRQEENARSSPKPNLHHWSPSASHTTVASNKPGFDSGKAVPWRAVTLAHRLAALSPRRN